MSSESGEGEGCFIFHPSVMYRTYRGRMAFWFTENLILMMSPILYPCIGSYLARQLRKVFHLMCQGETMRHVPRCISLLKCASTEKFR